MSLYNLIITVVIIISIIIINMTACGCRSQASYLEEMKEIKDNILKSWVEESPHPYENDSIINKVRVTPLLTRWEWLHY